MKTRKMKTHKTEFMQLAIAAIAAVAVHFAPAAGLREDFRAPQGAARENTGPLFWMHGDESEARLREMVGRVAESGQGALTIESRPHIDWMREGWWRDVDIVLDECKKRGLKMMVFDDYWWPSQGMGGKYPIPEKFQCRDVKGTVYWSCEAPEKAVSNEVARIVVKEIDKGVFKPGPDGDKTIIYTWFTSNGGFRFPTVNGLDEEAVDWFISKFYQPYYDRYAKEFKDGTIPGFFFDEPQFRSWWGDALAKELKARGDDAGELLTALKFKLADPEDQARARYRYHDARAETWGRTMYGRQSDWCRKHGVFSSGHFLEHSNCHYGFIHAAGNVMQQLKYVDVPGVDLVCRQYYPSQREKRGKQIACGQMPKYASSTAHVYNRHNGMNWCEIFGAYGQDLTYPQMKWMCDWHQYQGCYCMIPHAFNPRAPYDRDCPPYFYNGGKEPRYPLFRVWADYNNRCAKMLSDGEHVCHIAQCIPGISYHAGKTIRPEMFAFAVQDAQLDSDWMMYDAVESARIGKNPRTGRPALRTTNGKEWYDILSLPATEYVPLAVLEKALAFAKAGGVVVGYGIRPCNTPTRGKTADDARRVVDAIFAQPTALFIEGEPDGAALRAALAKKYPGTDQPLAVRAFDFPGLSAADGRMLAVNHYVKDGAQTLFIANQDFVRRRDLSLCAKWPVEKAELWDPMQGTVEKPVIENGRVKLALEPNQAVFLVWPKAGTGAALPRVGMPHGATVAANVKETVTPVVVEGAEKESSETALDYAKWIWHPVDPKAKGQATFTSKIDVPHADDAEIVFACDNEAYIYVNGREVAKQKTGDDNGNWRLPTKAKFRLNAGANEIKVLADNVLPGHAGFVCSIKWSAGMLLSDAQAWKVCREGEAAVKPLEICRYGQGVWGKLGSASKITRSPFAESVATELAFTLPELKEGERVYFVCDDVAGEKSAAVTVNGAYAGGFIGKPYRLDITKAVKTGANTLEAKPFRLKNPHIDIDTTGSRIKEVDNEAAARNARCGDPCRVFVGADSAQTYPVRDRAEITSLNGDWDFELAGRRGKIRVPGNWETQGWKTPQYGCVVDDMTGLYRRTFDFSPRWKGRRVVLRFDGVLFGLEVEINGKAVGTNDGASAFNLVQFDITGALREGENEIVCRVRSRSRTWLCDTNDDWGICGIFRDVEIFSVPAEAWIADVTFTSEGTNWQTKVEVAGPRKDAAKATAKMRGADRCGGIKPWSPEKPNLYDLVVSLELDGKTIQRVTERVGFRDLETRSDGLYANGEKIFIQGVDWCEIDPTEGRALSFETFYRNMALMKEAGINAIRTAHYPFSPKFYDLADSMGFWIINEVPIATRGKDLLANPAFRGDLIERAERTIRRDKNHPCVLAWSCGNENEVKENSIAVLDFMKEKDPTRPRLLPMRRRIVRWMLEQDKHHDFGKHVDIYSGHYLTMKDMKKLEKAADKPIMMTEFAHSRRGLQNFEEALAYMKSHRDKWIGGFVWQWRDQAILHDGKTFRGLDDEIKHWTGDGKRKWAKAKQGRWLDDGRIYDNWGFNGCDGIIYADMEPKEQFWRVKAAYRDMTPAP